MTSFFRKLGREKLYKQWIEQEGLSPEDLPEDLKKDERDSGDDPDYEISPGRGYRSRIGGQSDIILNPATIRFMLVMALIIVVLLVALSVLITVLIMR
ncbi:MAG: hypothetical protein Q8Q07_04610 [Dehalococcoidales bacterium]|nr:hypothetical protein [Dehalococcoidales bacterium]